MPRHRLFPPLAATASLLSLSACGSDTGVGGVSASEAQALNQAAATLDARSAEARRHAVGLNPAATAARDRRTARPEPSPAP